MSLYNPEGTPPIIETGVASIQRRLPYPGEILVRPGERVEPDRPIAKAFVPVPPHIVNVAQTLGIPASRIKRALRREVDNKIEQGEELAGTLPLFGNTCLAPVSGIISHVDTSTGYVTIAPEPAEFQLPAAVRGLVMDTEPYWGVTIETPATQVYGAFGFGHERSGVLRLLVLDPTEVVTPDQIDARSAYAILICGAGITAAALRRAVQEQVQGIIVGSIEEQEVRTFFDWDKPKPWYTGTGTWQFPDLRHMADPGLTLLVTEGFGSRPMSQPIFDLLSSKDRQEALIDGTTHLRHGMRRPRLVIPMARTSGQAELPRLQVQPGVKVRLLNAAHLGQIATVRTVSPIPRRIESGVYTPAVEVMLEQDASPFWLPHTAVEVLA